MKKFIVYIPAAYPDLNFTLKLLKEFSKMPVDGVEIGVPFSDPIADGPVIQSAYNSALKKNINLFKILSAIKGLRLPYELFIMSYLNPIICYPFGKKRLKKELEEARIKALIIPDLPVNEISNIDLNYPMVLFVAPNTTEDEIKIINRYKPPFVYYIARYGVTGEKKDLPYINHIKKLKRLIDSPLYVGFGISTAQQVKKVWDISDGAIVGSAIVKEMKPNSHANLIKKIKLKIDSLIPI